MGVKKLLIKLRFSERTRKNLKKIPLSFHVSLFNLAFTEYMNFYQGMSQRKQKNVKKNFDNIFFINIV